MQILRLSPERIHTETKGGNGEKIVVKIGRQRRMNLFLIY